MVALGPYLKMEFVLIPAGEFVMGSPETEQQATPATANTAEDKWGIEVPPERMYADYKKMFRDVEAGKLELDIVDVCTPNRFHKDPTVRGLRAGCHVIVEKPMATSAEVR